MPDWIDSPGDLASLVGIGVGLTVICSAALGGLIWLITAVMSIHKETKTNGGNTMRDGVDRTEAGMYAVYKELGELKGAISAHLDEHNRKDHAA